MPILKSAIKKVRVDKRRAAVNARTKFAVKAAVEKARKNATAKNVAEAARALAMAAKKKVIHKNKASRLLSRIAKKMKK